jgi:hypothetical protein
LIRQTGVHFATGKSATKFPRSIRSGRVETAPAGETYGFETQRGIEKTNRFGEG